MLFLEIEENYLKIKREVENLIKDELNLLKAKEILEETDQIPAVQPDKTAEKTIEDNGDSDNQAMSL